MSNNENILFYSNKCLHSKELLNLLHKDVELNQKFTKINVDNRNIKIPPYVKAVPTAIININGKPNLMVGSDIFKWYEQMHSKINKENSIENWDPLTMTGYSDGFSYLSEDSNVMKKNFSFVNENNMIVTPDEKNYSNEDDKKNQQKSQFDNEYETFMNQRKFDVPGTIPKI